MESIEDEQIKEDFQLLKMNTLKFDLNSTGLNTKNTSKEISNYIVNEILGSGSFGIVYKAICTKTKEILAIKKVLQDSRYKNRELQILNELNHPNIIPVKQFFYTPTENQEYYLNIVMEFIPETLSKFIKNYSKFNKEIPNFLIKIYFFQMIKAINYIQILGICHRDLKPQNILIDQKNYILKICDFGSAKKLIKCDSNISYICSRYYRAPELIFGASDYNSSIDVWSAGCILAEMVLLEPLFPGESSTDQIVQIIKVLGTPSKKEIISMNPFYQEYKFPFIKCFSRKEIFKNRKNVNDNFLDLLFKLLKYDPYKRIKPVDIMLHPFFNEIRDEKGFFENKIKIPLNLFKFSEEEINADERIQNLIPEWY